MNIFSIFAVFQICRIFDFLKIAKKNQFSNVRASNRHSIYYFRLFASFLFASLVPILVTFLVIVVAVSIVVVVNAVVVEAGA